MARLSGDWVLLHEDRVAQILIRATLRPPASRQMAPRDGKITGATLIEGKRE